MRSLLSAAQRWDGGEGDLAGFGTRTCLVEVPSRRQKAPWWDEVDYAFCFLTWLSSISNNVISLKRKIFMTRKICSCLIIFLLHSETLFSSYYIRGKNELHKSLHSRGSTEEQRLVGKRRMKVSVTDLTQYCHWQQPQKSPPPKKKVKHGDIFFKNKGLRTVTGWSIFWG